MLVNGLASLHRQNLQPLGLFPPTLVPVRRRIVITITYVFNLSASEPSS
jgi:hypothetical protein